MSEKWTIITGACGGLGRAFVNELAAKGENVFLTGTNDAKTSAWADELKKRYPYVKIDYAVMDLSCAQSRAALFDTLREREITASRLINNAGMIVEGAMLDLGEEKTIKAIETNCVGTADMMQKFISAFGDGVEILNVSSLGAFQPMPFMGVYSSTKRMILDLSLAVREEVKNRNIKVCVVCPGGIYTTDEMKKAIASQGLGGKLSSHQPEYVARYALRKFAKNKAIIIPGAFNRFLKFIGKIPSETFVAKTVGKRWERANKKREKQLIKKIKNKL